MPNVHLPLKKQKLSALIAGLVTPAAALGPIAVQAQEGVIELVIVTATRRANTVQDVPINISAVTGNEIADQRLYGLDEISRVVPGLTMLDRGPRDDKPDIVVRGLNTSDTGPRFSGGTVATYLGEIPMEADFRTQDLERVEVLIGPQGTLYGSGTLGGAIRFLPTKPNVDSVSGQVRGGAFNLDESDGIGGEAGFTVNVPFADKLAFRANVDYLDDPGYIDYPYLVREPGVSDPDPDFSDPAAVAANLRTVEDANYEETLSGRVGLRYLPTDNLDMTLWYHYQNVETGGRSMAQVESFNTGRYESAKRFEEPAEITNDLLSLEIIANLPFGELTSATGFSNFEFLGQRDQTDLLLNFEYYYETFPSFSAFTRDTDDEETFTQELRLVSTGSGRWSWIVGAFYSKFEGFQTSSEFTPGFDQWAVDNLGGVALRPDALEYYEATDEELTEKALFGEISYDFSESWTATIGVRSYEFEDHLIGGFALPLYDTVYFGEPPDSILIPFDDNSTDDTGTLLKLNVSHNFSNNILGYLTVSEGYRIGGVNSVVPCTQDDINNPGQALCALPDEVLIEPDETTNYEIGVHSTLNDGRVVFNAAVYQIDWDKVQVDDATLNGSLPIVSNGGSAETQGVELSARWRVSDNWQIFGSYAHTTAELTTPTDAILGSRETGALFTPAGSRLPGSPEDQASFGLTYSQELSGGRFIDISYSAAYVGDVLNSIAAEQFASVLPYRGETIPSYSLSSISAKLSADRWSASFYVDNLFDEYYYTSTLATQRYLEPYRMYSQAPTNVDGIPLRTYGRFVGRPRTMGLSFTYEF